MGTEAVRDFMNAAQEDETRRNELQAVTSDEEVLVFAQRLGYTFTKEDSNAWADEMKAGTEGKLSDEHLDAVSGSDDIDYWKNRLS